MTLRKISAVPVGANSPTLDKLDSGFAPSLTIDDGNGQLFSGGRVLTTQTLLYSTLQPADIIAAANGVPYLLVPAPGVGKFLRVLSYNLQLKFKTTPYTTSGGSLTFNYAALGSNVPNIALIGSTGYSNLMTATADQIVQGISLFLTGTSRRDTPYPRTDFENQAIQLFGTDSSLAGGDGSFVIGVWYDVLTLA